MLDEFLALDTASDQKDFQRNRGVQYATFCDVHAHDWFVNAMHSAIDYHFLHPTADNSHFYDKSAIEKTLNAMKAIDWEELDEEAYQQIQEYDADWFGLEYYPDVQALFEFALANDYYIVSFHDTTNMGDLEEWE